MLYGLRLAVAALLSLGLMVAAAAADSGRRVALVVGNNAYSGLPALANAVRDAESMAERLTAFGFEVMLHTDTDRRDLYRAIGGFQAGLGPGDVGLLFYAGHGIQSQGRNYLIPVDAVLETEWDLPSEAIDLQDIQQAMAGAGADLQILILDACRDNPLPARMRSIARGLATPTIPPGVSGSAILYATAPGDVALDGVAGGNGIFTGALLDALDTPDRPLEQLFKSVNTLVRARTDDVQKPFLSISLQGDFFFRPPTPAPAVSQDSDDDSALVWSTIQSGATQADLELFLERYPDSPFAPFARNRLTELEDARAVVTPPSPLPLESEPAVLELAGTYVTETVSNLRAGPTTEAERIATLKSDTLLRATGRLRNGDWIRVEHESGKAWIWAPLVSAVDADEHAAWTRASTGREVEPLRRFIETYPDSRYRERAEVRLTALRSPEPAPSEGGGKLIARRGSAEYRTGETFSDCDGCPEMVVIPAGTYWMGSKSHEEPKWHEGGPPQRIEIERRFAIGRYEVTLDQFRGFVAASGYRPKTGCRDALSKEYKAALSWERPGFEQIDQHPVTCISYDDAQAYVRWLTEKSGVEYRLPTEAEWEYVARAGSTGDRRWPTVSSIAVCQQENLANAESDQKWVNKACSDHHVFTAPVGRFMANGFGAFDLLGNVSEWVTDCWRQNLGDRRESSGAVREPACGRFVVRGGAWGFPIAIGYSMRIPLAVFGTSNAVGFRVARSLD